MFKFHRAYGKYYVDIRDLAKDKGRVKQPQAAGEIELLEFTMWHVLDYVLNLLRENVLLALGYPAP